MITKPLLPDDNSDQAQLTRKLISAGNAYYAGLTPEMSDIEFDNLVDKLKQMETQNECIYEGSPTLNVGAAVVSALSKVKHEYPALSLDKVKYKDKENLVKWLGHEDAVMSWKCDGLTVILTYNNGQLASAVTRGDGIEGSDITHNAVFFKGVPKKIKFEEHLVIRGEAVMEYAEFERINRESGNIYENPRNLAAATIQMLDANESRKRQICFKAFELVEPTPIGEEDEMMYPVQGREWADMRLMNDRLAWLEYEGFDVVEYDKCDSTTILEKIEEWKNKVATLSYPTDGIVISYNDLMMGWELGSTGHHPRWSIALKWTDETATSVIRDIEWSVGKTGVITPVAIFDPVRLGLGSNVTRASLHNLSIMNAMPWYDKEDDPDIKGRIMLGSRVKVYMANMIIPQILSVENTDKDKEITVPDICPVCGAKTQIKENNGIQTLYCTNDRTCAAQQVGKLVNALGKDGLDVKGLSEKKIAFLLQEGYIENVLDVYRLKNQGNESGVLKKNMAGPALEDQPGWETKSVDNLLDAIEKSRDTTLQRFLYSLNIPLLGHDLSKKLSKLWEHDINKFVSFVESLVYGSRMQALETLTAIEGVGEEKALNAIDSIMAVRNDPDAYQAFKDLVAELNFPAATINSSEQTLDGLTFVITGTVHDYANRDEFKASVEARGGKISGSVSKNTTALINNDINSTSGKNKKAKDLGVEIISEDEFISRYGR